MTAHGAPAAPPLPTEMQVEVTAACNLRCRMCLVSYREPTDRVHGSLDLSRFRSILDANPQVRRVTLQGLGEPLLAPDLLRIVELAAARGIDVGFNTNGTLLDRPRAERLVAAGLAWLHVSLDGATRATYEHIRRGSRFDRVVGNIGGLVDAKRAVGATKPSVQIVFVAMRSNIHELPGLVDLAAELGVDSVWMQNLSHSFDDTDPSGAYVEIRRFTAQEALWSSEPEGRSWDAKVRRYVDAACDRARAQGVALRLPESLRSLPPPEIEVPDESARSTPAPAPAAGCDWPWRSTYVMADGTVQPCCMVMGADRVSFGSLDQESFVDIWSGPRAQEFRRRLTTSQPPKVCRGCSLYRHRF
jgi:radical SAM protein with 4Fe4S-binding SPASM domain